MKKPIFALSSTLSALTALVSPEASGQLFDNLSSQMSSYPVGSGATELAKPTEGAGLRRADGPKWICAADFDKDGKNDFATSHLNGEITVAYGLGTGGFAPKTILLNGVADLRAILAADVNNDGRPDLVATAPHEGKLVVRFSLPTSRGFAPPVLIDTFKYARNVEAGDFDGDGRTDIVVAGPQLSSVEPPTGIAQNILHFRGTAGGALSPVGYLMLDGKWSNAEEGPLKPVYSLDAYRYPGETKDRLSLTYEGADKVWLFAANTLGELEITNEVRAWGVDTLHIGTITQPIASGHLDMLQVMQGG